MHAGGAPLSNWAWGGGGGNISLTSLVEVMVGDFPNHEDLMRFARRL